MAGKLFTIGFAKRSAESFFETLRANGVRRLIDIRLKPHGQLAGFTQQRDLPYFLQRLADGCEYLHLPDLAPSPEILRRYRTDRDWAAYEQAFEVLMDERGVPARLDRTLFDAACLLCSEPTPEQCHRRLVAERLAAAWKDLEVVHL